MSDAGSLPHPACSTVRAPRRRKLRGPLNAAELGLEALDYPPGGVGRPWLGAKLLTQMLVDGRLHGLTRIDVRDARMSGPLSRIGADGPRGYRLGFRSACEATRSGPLMAGHFIDVEIDPEVQRDPELARKLEEACPVDIFHAGSDGTEIVEENLDECILCRLCLDASPPGSIRVVKLYDDSVLE
jgi:NAD-dependent dihydropyrimidine dehydrogenase PreA subunit